MEHVVARVHRGARPVKVDREVAVRVDAEALAAEGRLAGGVRPPVLAPHPVGRPAVFVAVRVGHGQDIEVEGGEQVLAGLHRVGGLDQPLDGVQAGRRRDPLARVDAAVDPDDRFGGGPGLANDHGLNVAALVCGGQVLGGEEVGVGVHQPHDTLVDLLKIRQLFLGAKHPLTISLSVQGVRA